MAKTNGNGNGNGASVSTACAEVEKAILGCLLMYGATDSRPNVELESVLAQLEPALFSSERHGAILDAIQRTYRDGLAVDPVTIRAYVPYEVATTTEIASLLDGAPRPQRIEAYIQRLREAKLRRDLIAGCVDAIQRSTSGEPAGIVAARIEEQLRSLHALKAQTCASAHECMAELNRDLARNNATDAHMLATGLAPLDALTGGLPRGNVTILAARPRIGKTSLALEFARNVAASGRTVLYFSLEMPQREINARLVSAASGITALRVLHRNIWKDEHSGIAEAMSELARLDLWVDDRSTARVHDLRAQVAQLDSAGHTPDLVVVDHIGYLATDENARETRNDTLTRISRGLRELSKDTDAAFLVVSQMGRAVERRGDDEPMLSDIRDSGSLEQDAAVVLFLVRKIDEQASDTEATLIVAKQRNGPTGRIKLTFRGKTGVFEDICEHPTIGDGRTT